MKDRTDGNATITADWTPEEIETFAHLLQRYNKEIGRLLDRPWPRKDED